MSLADRILTEKRLTAAERRKLPSSAFGIPSQRKYPMPDKKHAAVAKGYAKRFASKSQEKVIDAKANKKLHSEDTFSRGALLTEKHMGFAKLKRSLAHKKHGPRNPAAVAAVIGRKKYGDAPFQKMAAKGRKAASYDESIDAMAELAALSESLRELKNTVVTHVKK